MSKLRDRLPLFYWGAHDTDEDTSWAPHRWGVIIDSAKNSSDVSVVLNGWRYSFGVEHFRMPLRRHRRWAWLR